MSSNKVSSPSFPLPSPPASYFLCEMGSFRPASDPGHHGYLPHREAADAWEALVSDLLWPLIHVALGKLLLWSQVHLCPPEHGWSIP